MPNKILTSCIFLFFCCLLHGQNTVSGIIKNSKTNKPIAFASIKINDGQNLISDSDGKFSFAIEKNTQKFICSFIDFESKTVFIEKSKLFYVVLLRPTETKSAKQVDAESQKALAIIQKVVVASAENNPLKKFKTFQFQSYSKLIVSATPDSILGKTDSVFVKRKKQFIFKKIDSTDYKFKKIISQHHLFETEKVSQIQYNKSLKETVLAIKVAGLKEPIYELMGFNLQSFSIYSPKYELFTSKYPSPICKKFIRNYFYSLVDSTEIENRKVVLVYFKSKSKSDGLSGILYIDTQNCAIAKAEMRVNGILKVSGSHDFMYLKSDNIWIPSKKIFKIAKGKNKEDIKILGGTIEFTDDNDDNIKSKRKTASDFTYLISETTNSNFKINEELAIKNKYIAIEIKNDANKKSGSYFSKFRADSLDIRSKKTYLLLDSISILNRIEKRLFLGRKIIKGYVPYNYFDMDLRSLLSFNNLEGFRVGIGGTTNEKLSKIFRADGYFAYGIKDKATKYQLGSAIRVGNISNSWIGVSYTNDLSEIAMSNFLSDKKVLKVYTSQPVSTNTFYGNKSFAAYIETRIIPKTFSVWQISNAAIDTKFDYNYLLNNKLYHNFTTSTAGFSIQWNPFSDFMQTPRGKLEIEKRYPTFAFQVTQAIPKFLNNDFVFTKIDFRAAWEKKFLNGQKSALLFKTGFATGDIPITHLYNASPNCLLDESLFRRFLAIITDDAFETMYFNEFFSDRYVFLQGIHSFKRIKFSKNFGVSFAFAQRVAWGNLKNQERHQGLEFKTLDQGFYESGLEMNQIFKGLGIGSFYRYGPNQLPGFYNNFAIKASFIFNLGL